MPTAGRHLTLAEGHFQASKIMARDPAVRSWAAVALFYAARDVAHGVFAIEPGLSEPFRHPQNHTSADHNRPGTNFVIRRHFRLRHEPVYLTQDGQRVAAIIDAGDLDRLIAAAEDQADLGVA